MVEEAEGTARSFDKDLLQQLERVRVDAPEMRRREYAALINDPGATDLDRQYLAQLAKSDLPDHGEREVLDALVRDSQPSDWFTGSRFLDLTGYSSAVWGFFTRKLTGVLNANLPPGESQFPWEAIRQLLRFGYLLKCGDALNHFVPLTSEPLNEP
jgi:hypothetical protein